MYPIFFYPLLLQRYVGCVGSFVVFCPVLARRGYTNGDIVSLPAKFDHIEPLNHPSTVPLPRLGVSRVSNEHYLQGAKMPLKHSLIRVHQAVQPTFHNMALNLVLEASCLPRLTYYSRDTVLYVLSILNRASVSLLYPCPLFLVYFSPPSSEFPRHLLTIPGVFWSGEWGAFADHGQNLFPNAIRDSRVGCFLGGGELIVVHMMY